MSETLRPSESRSSPTVNLALQGGGSHGAFTWGVLDALLEDGRLGMEGISGTSAGAMNAVALAHGFAQALDKPGADARELARQSLESFWQGIVGMGALTEMQRMPVELLLGSHAWFGAWARSLSPYQINPFDINPLRRFLERAVDFERLAALDAPRVFVVATQVSSGKAEVFHGKRLTADAVMASACLPTVFKAVEIEGEHYWDGGYSGNPAIHPLIYHCQARDILLVQISPVVRDKLPTTANEIHDRVNEVTFNAGLVAEMRAIDFVKRLLAQGKLDPRQYKDVLMHRIDGGEELEAFTASSQVSTNGVLIHKLRDLGRSCAQDWLARHAPAVGQRSTIDIKRDYLDDLRVPLARKGHAG